MKIQSLGWVYAIMFIGIASLSYIPGLADAQGNLFGLFSLQIHDDLLHLASGTWAAWSAWRGSKQTTFYFKLFGLIYFFDGVLGLITGSGYLDLGIFLHGPANLSFMTRLLTNLPHLVIGAVAIYIGFILSKRLNKSSFSA